MTYQNRREATTPLQSAVNAATQGTAPLVDQLRAAVVAHEAAKAKAKAAAEQARGAHLITDSKARKEVPIFSGVLAYFPDALADVARLSKIGNDKHNPGQRLHWSRGKSDDHADCLVRHQIESGTIDTDGLLHDAKVAWRALAQLQLAIEKLRAEGVDY